MVPIVLSTVCGIWTQEEIPETLKPVTEKDVVLEIVNITIHPNFVNGQAREKLRQHQSQYCESACLLATVLQYLLLLDSWIYCISHHWLVD